MENLLSTPWVVGLGIICIVLLGWWIESRQRIREMADGERHVQPSVNPHDGDLDKI